MCSTDTPLSLTLHLTEHSAVALLTQVFYCYRIAVFTKSKCAVAAIVMVQDKLSSAVFIGLTWLIFFSFLF